MQLDSLQIAKQLYDESKFWLAFGGALWSVFKAVNWVRAIKENDLHHIQTGLNGLHLEVSRQTHDIVTELREMRQDMRTFYARSRSPRKRR